MEIGGLQCVGREVALERLEDIGEVLELAFVGPLARDLEIVDVRIGDVGRRASVVWIGAGAADVDVDASVPSPADPYQVVAAARQLLGARASLEALEPDAVVASGGRVLGGGAAIVTSGGRAARRVAGRRAG